MIHHIPRWHEVRFRFLDTLPKNAIVAEIGVAKGIHAKGIFHICQPKKMYLIDPWFHQNNAYRIDKSNVPQEEFDERFDLIKSFFAKHPNVCIMRKYSHQAVEQFTDGYFDWVYIDANHLYKHIKNDLKIWWSKVKSGGYLCGHDYCIRDHIHVKFAVDEFVAYNNLSLELFGTEEPTWKIKKP